MKSISKKKKKKTWWFTEIMNEKFLLILYISVYDSFIMQPMLFCKQQKPRIYQNRYKTNRIRLNFVLWTGRSNAHTSNVHVHCASCIFHIWLRFTEKLKLKSNKDFGFVNSCKRMWLVNLVTRKNVYVNVNVHICIINKHKNSTSQYPAWREKNIWKLFQ